MQLEKPGLPLLRGLDPERAHGLALMALRMGLGPNDTTAPNPRLATKLGSLTLTNPLGLAAGFDKNATALGGLSRAGFGFVEVGAATPRPQPGNPRPRLFRLAEDQAVVNRFGFNNDGMEAIASRLAQRPDGMTLGLNLGANKDSADRAADFATVLRTCGPHVDFATINVSSPNTESLRDLQGKEALSALIDGVLNVRETLPARVPIFVKIAPDLTPGELDDIADVARATGIDGLIATNTTLDRTNLKSPHAFQKGGLSGAPLFDRSTRILAQLYQRVDGTLPIIGVGGIASGAEAYAKITAGASALQLYTALVYGGLRLVPQILLDLEALLTANGRINLTDAIGTRASDWFQRP